jgi:hypothetical protein
VAKFQQRITELESLLAKAVDEKQQSVAELNRFQEMV